MAEERRRIEIPPEVARGERVPEDLDATQHAPYTIPSTRRRRYAAWAHVSGAALAALAPAAGLPRGMWVIGGVLAAAAVWHLAAAWPIAVLDPAALDAANRETDFGVGHASAALGFDGWRARPVWSVLVFSADQPPSRRALVRVDAVDGTVVETYVEDVRNP